MFNFSIFSFNLNWKTFFLFLFGTSFFLAPISKGMTQEYFGTVPLPSPADAQGNLPTNTPQIEFSQNNGSVSIPVEYEYQSPQVSPTYSNPNASNMIYRVEVEGESPILLNSVRSVEPAAFTRRGEGVIQVGLFRNSLNAQNMVQRLSDAGIAARVVQISGNGNAFPLNVYGEIENEGYFVIIPGQVESLFDIAGKVKQSGIPDNALRLRSAPNGPHVAVGPFFKRDEAERWNTYLRSTGFDSRVYFGH